MPKELPKKVQGQELCQKLGERTQICVKAERFGYNAWLTGLDGKKLAPISIGKPPSLKQALRIAVGHARRIAAEGYEPNRDRRRGPRPRNPDGTLAAARPRRRGSRR